MPWSAAALAASDNGVKQVSTHTCVLDVFSIGNQPTVNKTNTTSACLIACCHGIRYALPGEVLLVCCLSEVALEHIHKT